MSLYSQKSGFRRGNRVVVPHLEQEGWFIVGKCRSSLGRVGEMPIEYAILAKDSGRQQNFHAFHI